MKRKVFTDGNGSKHIFVEGLGEYSPKNDYDRIVEENQRLTAIATKHATRADELYEALEKIMSAVKQYLEYEHDGDPWTEDARSMGEMDLNELDNEGVIEEIFSILEKSRIEAEGE